MPDRHARVRKVGRKIGVHARALGLSLSLLFWGGAGGGLPCGVTVDRVESARAHWQVVRAMVGTTTMQTDRAGRIIRGEQ
jgi:hypothetical protein